LAKILLYHIYPINHWQEITDLLFRKLPFDKIVVHVSLPEGDKSIRTELENFFARYPIDKFLYSVNSGTGEVDAMKSFVTSVDLQNFDVLTYMHCKGVTKPGNEHISKWTKLMRYFIIEKMSRCEKAFGKGYITYGINKTVPNQEDAGFGGSNFFYEGNFVSLNLKKVDLKKAVQKYLEHSYYGLEGFWGKLCSYELGYAVFNSGVNHYMSTVEEKDYTTALARLRYSMIRNYYRMRARFNKSGKS
jgi:hypothetical protein